MPSRTSLPLKDLTYSNGEQQSLLLNPSGKLLCSIYADGQLDDFKATLRTLSEYNKDFHDVLDRALREKNPAKLNFVEALVQKVDALGDVSDPKRDHRSPLWTAADAGNLHAIRLLVPVGGKRDLLARRLEAKDLCATTALHVAVVAACEDAADEKVECVAWLLDRHQECEVNANAQDQLGRPALYLAAKSGSLALVNEFLKHQNIGLDIVDEIKGTTPRAQILERFPDLGAQLSTRPEDVAMPIGDELLRLFEHADDADSLRAFCDMVESMDTDARELRHNCGDMSLIQLACHEGRTQAVDALLDKAPGLAVTPPNAVNSTPPLLLAVAKAHTGVLKVFLQRAPKQFEERTYDGDTVLINLVRHWNDENRSYKDCLELLLSDNYRHLVDVNATNTESGYSALFFAALYRQPQLTVALLNAGAWIGGVNRHGLGPLDFMSPDTLEMHLDACVEGIGHQGEDDRQIVFNYSCLREPVVPAPTSQKSVTPYDVEAQKRLGDAPCPEMRALLAVSRSKEMRRLLKHPVLNSFLDHKWLQMHSIFYVNAILYSLFVIFISWYIIEVGGGGGGDEIPYQTPGVFVLAFIGFIYVAVREIAQLLMDPMRYLKEIENAMEASLLVCAGIVIAQEQWPESPERLMRAVSAVTVLLAWGEFVLLLGRHPKFATYVEMLKTVTWNFLKFLIWFAGLIVAFALCFYTLFRGSPSENAFQSLALSSFKTLVMMTGELNLEEIPLDGLPYFSRSVFVIFVFIVIMVLLNLLNGLAVSDTQAIKDDAELVCCVSRVLMAERVESKLFGWLNVTRRFCRCLTPMALMMVRAALVFPSSQVEPKGSLMPDGSCVLIIEKPEAVAKPGSTSKSSPPEDAVRPSMFCCLLERVGATACCKVSNKVVKRADVVISKLNATSELRDLEKRLLSKIAEVSQEMEARLSHRVEDVAQEVARVVREALDQRTTQL